MFKTKEEKINSHELVSNLLSYIIHDEMLSTPVYLSEVKTFEDAHSIGVAPVIYIWNEDRDIGSYTVSVNGDAVAHLLEGALPRKHSQFNTVRDEVIAALTRMVSATIASVCENTGAFPSDLFSP